MTISQGSYVKIKDLRALDHDVAPYITDTLYAFIDNVFEVVSIGAIPDSDQAYYILKDNKYYWNKNWIEPVSAIYAYQDLVRLDRKWRG